MWRWDILIEIFFRRWIFIFDLFRILPTLEWRYFTYWSMRNIEWPVTIVLIRILSQAKRYIFRGTFLQLLLKRHNRRFLSWLLGWRIYYWGTRIISLDLFHQLKQLSFRFVLSFPKYLRLTAISEIYIAVILTIALNFDKFTSWCCILSSS